MVQECTTPQLIALFRRNAPYPLGAEKFGRYVPGVLGGEDRECMELIDTIQTAIATELVVRDDGSVKDIASLFYDHDKILSEDGDCGDYMTEINGILDQAIQARCETMSNSELVILFGNVGFHKEARGSFLEVLAKRPDGKETVFALMPLIACGGWDEHYFWEIIFDYMRFSFPEVIFLFGHMSFGQREYLLSRPDFLGGTEGLTKDSVPELRKIAGLEP